MRALRPAKHRLDTDQTDYQWSVDKLDALLADTVVEQLVADTLCLGFQGREFDPAPIYQRCRELYRRKESAALLFFLAARLFERRLEKIGHRSKIGAVQ